MDKINHPTFASLTTCYTWKYVALQKLYFTFQNCNQVVNARGVCFSLKAKWFWMRTTSSGRLSHPVQSERFTPLGKHPVGTVLMPEDVEWKRMREPVKSHGSLNKEALSWVGKFLPFSPRNCIEYHIVKTPGDMRLENFPLQRPFCVLNNGHYCSECWV